MEKIKIGKLVNTHGIKGEVRIISNFEYKNKLFIIGNHLYIDNEELTINSYRVHKNFDMVTFKEYNYINDILKFKGKDVYASKEEINLKKDELLIEDYIGLKCIYEEKEIGYISDVITGSNRLFLINGKYVPFNENFIEKVDIDKKEIHLKNLEGLLWE